MVETLRQFVESIDPLWQWLGLIAIGAIPYVESYGGAAIGVVVGVTLPVAIAAAVIGNWLCMYLLVMFGDGFRKWRNIDESSLPDRQKKFKNMFNKFGVPGVSLFGQTILPSQITAMAMVAFGARKRTVIVWQTVSIILWGVVIGTLAWLGVDLLV